MPVRSTDLRRESKLLEVGCTRCWNVRYVDPLGLPFHGNMAVPETKAKRMSLRAIAAELAAGGKVNDHGKPYNPKSIAAMLAA